MGDVLPPAWALGAIVGYVEGDPAEMWTQSIRVAVKREVARHFPGVVIRSLPAESAVVLEWIGAPSEREIAEALGMGFTYEDRGTVRASIDSWDTVGWPSELDLVAIVLKRHEP